MILLVSHNNTSTANANGHKITFLSKKCHTISEGKQFYFNMNPKMQKPKSV